MDSKSPLNAPTPAQTAVANEVITAGWMQSRQRWQVVNANHAARAFERLLLDSTAGAFTVDMPASPTTGDAVEFSDPTESWELNTVTIAGNGHTIHGDANLYLNVAGAAFTLTFNGVEWRVRP